MPSSTDISAILIYFLIRGLLVLPYTRAAAKALERVNGPGVALPKV